MYAAPLTMQKKSNARVVTLASATNSDAIQNEISRAPYRGERLVSVCADQDRTTLIFEPIA